jgi:DNA-binding transcriptional regulator YiaG
MNHQDWNSIEIHSKVLKNVNKKIETRKGDTSILDRNNKLENNNSEVFKHDLIPKELSKEITQTRVNMKMTQKDFANKLNIQSSIYNELENGKSKYNIETKKLINKIENIYKIKFNNK